MLTLAIDSATEACSVALFDNDGLVAGDWRMLGRGHGHLHDIGKCLHAFLLFLRRGHGKADRA